MRPLSQDLSILSKFDFEHPPVGVKFLLDKPETIEPLDKAIPFCQMIREAQERGRPFYFAQENEDCFGTVVLGMVDMPPFAESGMVGERFEIFQEARANNRIYQHIPKFSKGTVNYVALSPLNTLPFDPDVLILMASPSQAEIVLRAMSYSTGELWETKKTEVLGCAWLYIYPYQSGKVNYTPTGLSFGMKAHEVFPEGWILISIPYDWIPVIVQNLTEMKWDLPSYTEGLDKFLQRKQSVLQETMSHSADV